MFLTGLVQHLQIIFLLLKFNFRHVLRHDISIHIEVHYQFCVMLFRTVRLQGMMTGLVAGCIIYIFLFVFKKLFGYETIRVVNRQVSLPQVRLDQRTCGGKSVKRRWKHRDHKLGIRAHDCD